MGETPCPSCGHTHADDTRAAARPKISMHPGIYSGVPCIDGRCIPVYMVAGAVWHGGIQAAIDTWDLTREQVLTVCWFVGTTGLTDLHTRTGTKRRNPSQAEWIKRWRAWADSVHPALWAGDYAVPDPPTKATALHPEAAKLLAESQRGWGRGEE